jgi:phytoene synthase
VREGAGVERVTAPLADAYESCLRLARSHYENFPVASTLVPAKLRPHIAAIYAFARTADDFADEPGRTPEERLRLLDDWSNQLSNASHPMMVALRDTIDRFDLPVQLFLDLLSAFRQDVRIQRYDTWADLLDYCERSANPVGRLVLRVFGYRHDDLDAASDAFCTALQLTNFWQDFSVDWSRGRLYVPEENWSRHHADPSTLTMASLDTAWKETLRDVTGRTRLLFDRGRSVCDGVSGRLRYELRATWLGGVRVLDQLQRSGFDVYKRRPSLGTADWLVIACRTVAWRRI